MNDEFKYKLELLKHELDLGCSNLRAYRQMQLIIKGWAITLFSGFSFFAVRENQPLFLVLAAITIGLFWYLDAICESTQQVYFYRVREIEVFLQNLNFSQDVHHAFQYFRVPHVEASFSAPNSKEWGSKVYRVARDPYVAQLYILMLMLLLLLFRTPIYG